MNKKEKAKLYFEELRKLVRRCPKGYELFYDIDKGMFMVPKDAEFDHGSSCNGSLVSINLGHYRPSKNGSDGYMVIVANGIDQINLAAASDNAVIETEME